MRAKQGKKSYVVHGHFKLGELQDLGRQWGRRLSFSVQNDNGGRVHGEMAETSLIWVPKLHSITDTMEVCYAKAGYEIEVLKTLADAKKEYEAQQKRPSKK